jgi:hypothetical protein
MTSQMSIRELLAHVHPRLGFVGLATAFFMVGLAGFAYACVPWGGTWTVDHAGSTAANEQSLGNSVGGNFDFVMKWCDSSQPVQPAAVAPSDGPTDPDLKITLEKANSSCASTDIGDAPHLVSAVNSGYSELTFANLIGGSSFDETAVTNNDRDRDCMTQVSTQQPNAPTGNLFYVDRMSWIPDPGESFVIDDISLDSDSGYGGLVPSEDMPWNSVAGVCVTAQDTTPGHSNPEGIMLPVKILDYNEVSVPGSNA